ncbi:MAG: hypothetical protein ABJA02_03495 [Acidobacteriota bacterium]
MSRWLLLVSIGLTFVCSVVAQTAKAADDTAAAEVKAKLEALEDRIQSDASGLALGENRAYVDARLGSLACKSDKKLSVTLFQSSVGELINGLSAAEADAKGHPNRPNSEIKIALSIRPAILTTIAGCDGVFALESLYRTRTGTILRVLAQNLEPNGKAFDTNGLNSLLARSEMALEQKLTLFAAAQNPELAIKMLQESIRKGLSQETLGLLKKLFDKDPESANSLASEVLDRLSAANFSTELADIDNVTLAQAILSDYIKTKKPDVKELKFDDLAIRSLAQKLISYMLTASPGFGVQRFPAVIAIAEKLQPGSVAALKKMQKSGVPKSVAGYFDSDARKILTDRSTPDQMLSDAKRLSPDARPMIYQAAASKLAQSGDLTRANDLLNANFSGATLENAINQMNAAYASYLVTQARFDEAERFIDEFPESTRFNSLLNLANSAFRKDKVENKQFALNVLRKVRSLLPEHPDNPTELSQFMQLTNAFSAVEPDEAFATIEPLVSQLNGIAEANAVVQGFQNNFNVRSGEFELAVGNPYGFLIDPTVFRLLSKSDFERTLKLIDSFSRREIRISFRLQLAENPPK